MEYEYAPSDLREALPKRSRDSNKGSYGKVLVIAGSRNICGAAYLCGKAAYRAGAGLVYLYTEECNRVILQQLLPEALLITYEPGREENRDKLREALCKKDAVVAGPGLGKSRESREIVKTVLEEAGAPLLLDADALNILADDPSLFDMAKEPFLITPHMGEMARLCKKSVQSIKPQKAQTALQFSREHHVITVLKDAETVTSDGRDCFWNRRGNHGMAVGGSGDVLAGTIGGLLAQKMPLLEAAKLGVYLHAFAGDMARKERGAYSMMAGDILERILYVPGL